MKDREYKRKNIFVVLYCMLILYSNELSARYYFFHYIMFVVYLLIQYRVGIALSIMGFTALVVQTFAGDIIDKTMFDRRKFLALAAIATAFSASAILFVREGNSDHILIYITKVIEGIASSFIAPCLAALTLSTSGPELFDGVMASNILWGHLGSVASAILAGVAGYYLYPNIKYCFLVIGFSALMAVFGTPLLPEGDPKLGRGLRHHCDDGKVANGAAGMKNETEYVNMGHNDNPQQSSSTLNNDDEVSSYASVFADRRTLVLCLTGFFFHFANANVLLVLGELMGGDNDDGSVKRSAIPLIAGAIVLAQFTMSGATVVGDQLTKRGIGRKPLFLVALSSLPLRCALIIMWKDSGSAFLLSTQFLDGVGGGLFGLLHPYIVNDIAWGSGRFNVLMGLTASSFGLGATLSNLLGQILVEKVSRSVLSVICIMVEHHPSLVATTTLAPRILPTRWATWPL